MPTNIIMPQMGESVAEGTVTKWLKRVGDQVQRDEPLFEISTDKVDAEIPSPAAGVLAQILVKENETVAVNTVVGVIDGDAAGVSAAQPQPAAPAGPAPGVAEARPAPAAPASAAGAPPQAPAPSRDKIRSSPLVRRIAREHNVDLAYVRGTGLGGRVSKKDILAYLAQPGAPREVPPALAQPPAPPPAAPGPGLSAPPAPVAPAAPAPAVTFTGATQVAPMTAMRRQIAEHMVLSKRTAAHVTTVFEVQMTRVFELRAQHAAAFEQRHGIKLTFTPFFVRAAVEALKRYPVVNASVDGTNIVYRRDINVGVAVALETGLIVPVIKHADEKNFLGIARAVQDLAERARSKRLSVDDVQGGTFTLTNPGIFGSLFGTPIINQPQVAIMGVGAIEKRPVVRNDAIAIRPMVYLALSFDHRLIDGSVADQFMGKVEALLENWEESVV